MDNLDVNVGKRKLNVIPLDDDSFTILDENRVLGTIWPIIRDVDHIEWVTPDLLALDYVQKIGEAIESKEM